MQNELTKMCPSCDGNVAMDAIFCPYCGSDVFEKRETNENEKNDDDVKSLSYEETLSSLYPPPYKPKAIQTDAIKQYENQYDSKREEAENSEEDLEENNDDVSEAGSQQNALIPTGLFWLGINILVFSVLLLVFSQNGVLYLKWNAKFWFIYSIISIPLVYFGFKGLNNLD